MVRRFSWALFAVAACFLFVPVRSASAGYVYNLEFSGPTQVIGGQTINIDVFLVESFTGATTTLDTILGDPTQGATGGTFRVTRSGAGGNAITSALGSVDFDNGGGGATINTSASSATVEQIDLLAVPTTPTGTQSGSTFRLFLGQISVVGSNIMGAQNTFTFQDFGAGDDLALFDANDVLGTAGVLDGIVNYGSITITAVPEPSSMLLGGMFACGSVVAAWRRRKRTK